MKYQILSLKYQRKCKSIIANWNFSYGYTLIEILVGLTIIGIIFGIGFVSFREFSRRQSLAGSVKSLVGDIRLAQEQALAGKKPDDLKCTGGLLNGYNFRVTAADTYQIEADCTGGMVVIKNVTVPSDLTLVLPSVNPILFKTLGQGTNIVGGEETQVVITQLGTANTAKVTISAGGDIK